MFICDNCKKSSKPGESLTLQVTSSRYKEYPERQYVLKKKTHLDTGGYGEEIAKTQNLCPRCA